jgi:hypothetical protein
MKQLTSKQRIVEAMQELPEDATVEEAMYKLYVLDEVSKALANDEEKIAHENIKSQVLQD